MFEGMEGNPSNEGGTPITGSDEWADGSQSFLRYEVVSIFDFIKPVAYNLFSFLCANSVKSSHPQFIVGKIKRQRIKWEPKYFNSPIVFDDFLQFVFRIKNVVHTRI